jgi:trans-2,3-dihydro-3-hydroxyanthranilate isomerase
VRYFVYDVFTDRPFTGNQLAIFPEAEGLAEGHLMAICREFNFSEVTFVLPPGDPAHTARVRIFSPSREMAFAGHPTIGTAVALHDLGRGSEMVLELGIGPVPCRVGADGARFTNAATLEVTSRPDPALVAACLSLDPADIRLDRHAPAVASVGNPFVLVELVDARALARSRPQTQAMQTVLETHPDSLDCSIYAYVRDGDALQARMFGALGGIPEDPATGSAAAALGAFFADLDGEARITIRQGEAMGRPSRIGVHGTRGAVTISGQAVRVMEGRLTI